MSFITATQFKARFPEFASLEDDVITPFITESDLVVNSLWPADARALAQGLYVAHAMKLDGFGSTANLSGNAEAATAIAGLAGVTRFKIDDLEVAISDKMTDAMLGDPLQSTQYGRRFIAMRRKYFGGVWSS